MEEGHFTQPYPCICKGAIFGFEPMTNWSPRHDFTAVSGPKQQIDKIQLQTERAKILGSYYSYIIPLVSEIIQKWNHLYQIA